MQLAEAVLRLFASRIDVYAEQQSNGSYLKIEKPLTVQVVRKHLSGEITMGFYQLDHNNDVKWLCWDLDPEKLPDPLETAKKIIEECISKPTPQTPRFYKKSVLLEASRHPDPSYHVWAFFHIPIPAKAARWLGLKILEHANINPKLVEVFPKQTELTKDRPYGNLVKAPLGFHRVKKKWSCFLDLFSLKLLPNSCIFNVYGVSFPISDLATICRFEDKKHVQIRLETPKKCKPLKSKEEEKIVSFLCRYWQPGNRNRLEMAFLGWCLKKGINYESAYGIIDKVTRLTDDEERGQRLQLVKYHYKNRRNVGSNLLGIAGLREIVKEAIQ